MFLTDSKTSKRLKNTEAPESQTQTCSLELKNIKHIFKKILLGD